MQFPADQILQQFGHPYRRGDPGTVDGELPVDDHLADIDAELTTLADQRHPTPSAGVPERGELTDAIARAVDRSFGPVAKNRRELIIVTGWHCDVDRTKISSDPASFRTGVDADHCGRAHRLRHQAGGVADRT